MLGQYIISGISTGSLYAITALGLVMLYKTTGLINFAHGELAMLTTFLAKTMLTSVNMPYVPMFFLSILFAALMGILMERFIFRKAAKFSHLNQIILTISLFTLYRGVASTIWGYDASSFPIAVSGDHINIGSAIMDANSLFIVCLTVAIMLILFLFFKYTRAGLAMRAIAMNMRATRLMGIKVNTVNKNTWAIACFLGAIAGVLIAPTTFVTPTMMGEVQVKAFAASVLGGFDSMPGAVLGGLAVGVLENLIAGYVSADMKTTCIFLLIILVLSVKPNGLFGKKIIKKV